jgi:hypothetical protein
MLAWGITIYKTQGLTLDKVVELGVEDFSAGLTLVVISWVKIFELGFQLNTYDME